MALYKPTELRQFLMERGIEPRRSMSQNFLIDGNIVRKIVKAADVASGDTILEIGPGPGVLTEELLAQGAEVIAIEKDRELASALARLQPSEEHRLHIIVADALHTDWEVNLKPYSIAKGAKAKVVANLPYNITTPLITSLLPRYDLFSHIVVMVQHEVAERMAAAAGSSAIGSLTIFCQFFSEIQYAFGVKCSCFFPAPSVDSAVVIFTLKRPPLEGAEQEKFFTLTRTAYQQRRKMLRGSLSLLSPSQSIEDVLAAIGAEPTARPEQLSLLQWIALTRSLPFAPCYRSSRMKR